MLWRSVQGWSCRVWSIAQCTYRHSLSFICADDRGDSVMTVTGEVSPYRIYIIKLAPAFPKNPSLSHPTNMLTNLFGCVSLPGLWFLLICFAAGPSCCVPVSLSFSAALAWTQASQMEQSSAHCRAIHQPVAIWYSHGGACLSSPQDDG